MKKLDDEELKLTQTHINKSMKLTSESKRSIISLLYRLRSSNNDNPQKMKDKMAEYDKLYSTKHGFSPPIYDPHLIQVTKNILEHDKNKSFLTFDGNTFVGNQVYVDNVNNMIKAEKFLTGAVKSVFGLLLDTPGAYVIKVLYVCPDGNRLHAVEELCNMATNGDIIYRIQNSPSGKTIVWVPNYILEPIIGVLLGGLEQYTSAFMHVGGFLYNPQEYQKPVYIYQERLEPINNYIKDLNSFYHFLFQIVQGIYVAQTKNRYVHYDIHSENTMARPVTNVIRCYEIGNGKFFYTTLPFDAVIIDYGLNRMETKNEKLIPRLKIQSNGRDILDLYEFNPYYDIFTFLYHNISKAKQSIVIPPFSKLKLSLGAIDVLNSTFYDFLNVGIKDQETGNIKVDDEFIFQLDSYLRVNQWRPAPEKLATAWQDPTTGKYFSGCSSAGEVLANIANQIEKNQTIQSTEVSYSKRLSDYLTQYGLFVSDRYVSLQVPNMKFKFYPLVPKSERMDTSYNNYELSDEDVIDDVVNISLLTKSNMPTSVRKSWSSYSLTGTNLNAVKQYVQVATIDVNAGKKAGYKFNFECCKIDPRTYLQPHTIKSGIVINSAFFNINTDKLPIGEYKSDNFSSHNLIPEKYKQFYGVLGINRKGELEIGQTGTRSLNQYMSVGPLLVINGKEMFTEDLLGSSLFRCSTSTSVKGVKDCSQIIPGELAHGTNPNPRTAVGIKNDGSVIFVRVEGRGNRGSGMDFKQLGGLMFGLGCKSAINLDGGGSSQMVWKNQGENVIKQAGSENSAYAYEVGGIISYVKK